VKVSIMFFWMLAFEGGICCLRIQWIEKARELENEHGFSFN